MLLFSSSFLSCTWNDNKGWNSKMKSDSVMSQKQNYIMHEQLLTFIKCQYSQSYYRLLAQSPIWLVCMEVCLLNFFVNLLRNKQKRRCKAFPLQHHHTITLPRNRQVCLNMNINMQNVHYLLFYVWNLFKPSTSLTARVLFFPINILFAYGM